MDRGVAGCSASSVLFFPSLSRLSAGCAMPTARSICLKHPSRKEWTAIAARCCASRARSMSWLAALHRTSACRWRLQTQAMRLCTSLTVRLPESKAVELLPLGLSPSRSPRNGSSASPKLKLINVQQLAIVQTCSRQNQHRLHTIG